MSLEQKIKQNIKTKVIPFVVCLKLASAMYVLHNYDIKIVKAKADDYIHSTWAGYYIDVHKKTDFEKEYERILKQ